LEKEKGERGRVVHLVAGGTEKKKKGRERTGDGNSGCVERTERIGTKNNLQEQYKQGGKIIVVN